MIPGVKDVIVVKAAIAARVVMAQDVKAVIVDAMTVTHAKAVINARVVLPAKVVTVATIIYPVQVSLVHVVKLLVLVDATVHSKKIPLP